MTEILKIDPQRPQPELIERAAELLRAGEVVGIPTDTVYGLASDAFNGAAAEKVFALKDRPATMPLLILVNSMEMARGCMAADDTLFERLAERFWPGPLTIVVPAAPHIPQQVTAGSGTVGIRLPRWPIAASLVSALEHPITASSANRSGLADCRTAAEVMASVGENLQLILEGGTNRRVSASTVIRVVDGTVKVLREGAISEKAISASLSS
jgi:L-threonylcarbamoyladenylate synthase